MSYSEFYSVHLQCLRACLQNSHYYEHTRHVCLRLSKLSQISICCCSSPADHNHVYVSSHGVSGSLYGFQQSLAVESMLTDLFGLPEQCVRT